MFDLPLLNWTRYQLITAICTVLFSHQSFLFITWYEDNVIVKCNIYILTPIKEKHS